MDHVKEHFEEEAPDFDRIILNLIPYYPQMLKALVSAMPFGPKASPRVIDLGSGTGTVALAIANAFPHADLTCLDVAENMIAMARSKLACHKRTKFIVGDFVTLQFDGEYDAVVSSLALHHLVSDEDKRSFYRRVYETLNRGGVFYNADVVLGSNEFLQSVYMAKWAEFMRCQISEEEIQGKWLPKYRTEDRPAKLADHVAWLNQIGFADVDILWKHYNFAVWGGLRR